MTPRLSGQTCNFFKFPLSLDPHKRFERKENQTKYRSLSTKPRNHVRILIYLTCAILPEKCAMWITSEFCRDSATSSSSPPSAVGAIDLSSLEVQCLSFMVQGLASSTRSSYASGQKKFYDSVSDRVRKAAHFSHLLVYDTLTDGFGRTCHNLQNKW